MKYKTNSPYEVWSHSKGFKQACSTKRAAINYAATLKDAYFKGPDWEELARALPDAKARRKVSLEKNYCKRCGACDRRKAPDMAKVAAFVDGKGGCLKKPGPDMAKVSRAVAHFTFDEYLASDKNGQLIAMCERTRDREGKCL